MHRRHFLRNNISNEKVSTKKAIQFHTLAYRTVQVEELNGKPTKNAADVITVSLIAGGLVFLSGRNLQVSLSAYRVSSHFPHAKVRFSSLVSTLVSLFVPNHPAILRVC
jgi:hypothetical protein